MFRSVSGPCRKRQLCPSTSDGPKPAAAGQPLSGGATRRQGRTCLSNRRKRPRRTLSASPGTAHRSRRRPASGWRARRAAPRVPRPQAAAQPFRHFPLARSVRRGKPGGGGKTRAGRRRRLWACCGCRDELGSGKISVCFLRDKSTFRGQGRPASLDETFPMTRIAMVAAEQDAQRTLLARLLVMEWKEWKEASASTRLQATVPRRSCSARGRSCPYPLGAPPPSASARTRRTAGARVIRLLLHHFDRP